MFTAKMKIAFQGFVMLFTGARPDFDFKNIGDAQRPPRK